MNDTDQPHTPYPPPAGLRDATDRVKHNGGSRAAVLQGMRALTRLARHGAGPDASAAQVSRYVCFAGVVPYAAAALLPPPAAAAGAACGEEEEEARGEDREVVAAAARLLEALLLSGSREAADAVRGLTGAAALPGLLASSLLGVRRLAARLAREHARRRGGRRLLLRHGVLEALLGAATAPAGGRQGEGRRRHKQRGSRRERDDVLRMSLETVRRVCGRAPPPPLLVQRVLRRFARLCDASPEVGLRGAVLDTVVRMLGGRQLQEHRPRLLHQRQRWRQGAPEHAAVAAVVVESGFLACVTATLLEHAATRLATLGNKAVLVVRYVAEGWPADGGASLAAALRPLTDGARSALEGSGPRAAATEAEVSAATTVFVCAAVSPACVRAFTGAGVLPALVGCAARTAAATVAEGEDAEGLNGNGNRNEGEGREERAAAEAALGRRRLLEVTYRALHALCSGEDPLPLPAVREVVPPLLQLLRAAHARNTRGGGGRRLALEGGEAADFTAELWGLGGLLLALRGATPADAAERWRAALEAGALPVVLPFARYAAYDVVKAALQLVAALAACRDAHLTGELLRAGGLACVCHALGGEFTFASVVSGIVAALASEELDLDRCAADRADGGGGESAAGVGGGVNRDSAPPSSWALETHVVPRLLAELEVPAGAGGGGAARAAVGSSRLLTAVAVVLEARSGRTLGCWPEVLRRLAAAAARDGVPSTQRLALLDSLQRLMQQVLPAAGDEGAAPPEALTPIARDLLAIAGSGGGVNGNSNNNDNSGEADEAARALVVAAAQECVSELSRKAGGAQAISLAEAERCFSPLTKRPPRNE